MQNLTAKKSLPSIIKNKSAVRACLFAGLVILSVYLIVQLILGRGGYFQRQALSQQVITHEQEVEDFTKRNSEIEQRIIILKSDVRAIEGQARDELGLIKPNETYYQVVTAVYDQ